MASPKRRSIFKRLPSISSLFSRASRIRSAPTSARSSVLLSPYETNCLPSVSSVANSTDQAEEEYERTYPLLDVEALNIKPRDYKWFRAVDMAVRATMNGPRYDVSCNFQHVCRVIESAKYILPQETKQHDWAWDPDPVIVYLGCMMHDIGDRKRRDGSKEQDQVTIIEEFLAEHDVPINIKKQIAYLASRLSFTSDMHDQAAMNALAEEHPAFRVI